MSKNNLTYRDYRHAVDVWERCEFRPQNHALIEQIRELVRIGLTAKLHTEKLKGKENDNT